MKEKIFTHKITTLLLMESMILIKIFYRFKEGGTLGQGSYGRVYQAINMEDGSIIAIKEIDIERLSKKVRNVTHVVQTEIELLSKLSHKNIIKYLGAFGQKKKLNILLEYCAPGSLAKLINDFNSFNETLIRRYTIQILEGIEYLHTHNVIHRDIKCANILVNENGTCKLSDFGGSKIIKDEYDILSNSLEGTPNWMAPEVVKYAETTRFSDIWSIGCTVIEMLQGKPPWSECISAVEVLQSIYNAVAPPKIPAHASPELKDFIGKCLQIEPKKRWNVYQLLKHPFLMRETNNIISDQLNNNDTSKFLI